jgi:sugar lactone lactonase YvrE
MAAPAAAEDRPEPFNVDEGIKIGRAAETNGLNGIYVSPLDGNVYNASVGGDEITVHDPETGEVLNRLGPESGVHGPDDLFITEDGTIYWTEILLGNVGMLAPGSDPVRQFVGTGVNPITMSDDGRLFVGRIFLGTGLYELDPDLVDPPVLLDENLVVNGFDFGPDGYLYAPSFFTGEVVKIDVDATPPVGASVVADGFGILSSVKFDSMGEAHTVDLGEGQVWKLDLIADNHELLIDIEGTIDNMAFDADGRLFVAAGADNQIIRRDSNGVHVLNLPGLGLPGGVGVSPDGTVWVAELFALRGFESNPKEWATSFYDSFAPPGTGFGGATTVVADGDNLIISSGFANTVQVMNPATGAVSLDIRTLAAPTNAIRHGDMLVAAQLLAGNVVDAENPTEVLIDSLAVPLGLASDGETLYVGDWATGDLWAVADGGTSLLTSGLMFPEGLAVDGERLLVVETGAQQVTAVDLATGDRSAVIVGLDYTGRTPEAFFPFGIPSGVAVGADRSIYVSDDGVNQVYEFRRRGTTTEHTDTVGNIFADDIAWVGQAGITFGCNPPANDNYCPSDDLTRGQLAAMFVRALDLPASTTDFFTDDDTSIFENDINALAEAEITFGCNPPANDNYCPLDLVNRGQVAAMFARALELPASTTDFFTDDNTSAFEDNINALAEAGITRGCNPPANDNYCPEDTFNRGQMAAFWRRALG